MPLPAILVLASKKGAVRWLIHLGGPGLIVLGLADNSLVPMPGSTDVVTILLAAHHPSLWLYFAMMSTVGAVLGGFLTYHMARKGGKETLEKRFSKKKIEKVYAIFERWGFASVAIPAMLPPPFPIVPMLLAAGAMQYPARRFLAALTVGRGIRFAILGYLGASYGAHIVGFFARYYWPVLIVVVGSSVGAGLYGLYQYKRRRKASHHGSGSPKAKARRRTA
jgi:membrane protein YqaA with SNARE-associated domain